MNQIGDNKFKVDETYKRSNLIFIDIDKNVVSAPDMVKRLEEVIVCLFSVEKGLVLCISKREFSDYITNSNFVGN